MDVVDVKTALSPIDPSPDKIRGGLIKGLLSAGTASLLYISSVKLLHGVWMLGAWGARPQAGGPGWVP
jgi:hypothetical protein